MLIEGHRRCPFPVSLHSHWFTFAYCGKWSDALKDFGSQAMGNDYAIALEH